MSTTIRAHFDGQCFVPDEPVTGIALGAVVAVVAQEAAPASVSGQIAAPRMPLTLDVESVRAMVTDSRQPSRPLDINIDPELARAIAEDPEFNIEES